MPYDSSLDKQFYSKSWEHADEKITVSVYAYNNGQKKLQITREAVNADGSPRFAKLGRMTKEEVQGILPLIQEAMGQMD
ncbi:MAG: hypothetical protein HY714_04150 [Candidatus Omnitrophica bacterium]|nr:hypothetical protein [Candidatus Omnitrophota bacterium]